MAFDLAQVMAQAAQAAEQNEGNGNSKEKLIYPQNGKLQVRILFNPKSQVVIRKFERHNINGNKVPCLSNYSQDCPICKVLGDIKNSKGKDLYSFNRKSRGICYAEYVASDYKWDKPEYEPKSGEVVMLMFPWTIYQDLNKIISSAGAELPRIVASNTGYIVNIERYTENNQVKYKASLDPFNSNHQTRPDDSQYNELLMGLDSLNDKFVPLEITDDIVAKNKELADQLSREYLNPVATTQPNMMQQGMNLGGMMPNMMQQPSAQPAMPQTPPTSTQDAQGNWYDMVNGQWVLRQVAQPTPQVPPMMQQPSPSMVSTAPQGMPNQGMPTPVGNPQVNTAPPLNNVMSDPSKPACFGKANTPEVNPNQCLLCPAEAECSAQSLPFN